MKKNFLLLCGLLLSVCGFVACSTDDTPEAPEPTFPELVTKTAEAGEVIDIDFSANYDWTATISEETFAYFQLLDGETTVNTLSGEAGECTIKVQVADEVIFENAPVAKVTLAMNGKSQVIAEISYPVAEREVSVYAPMTNTFGGYKSGDYNGTLLYSYNETAMTAEDIIAMEWGVERKNSDDPNSFYAPALIKSNFAYTLAGPAWMVAAEAGVVGESEYIIRADVTKIPEESETATINILAGEEQIASFKVAITGANDFAPESSLAYESEYAYDGEELEGVAGTLLAGNFEKIICDAEGTAVEWLTISETAEGEEVIKEYEISATVTENEGTAPRTAYVFYFAKNAVPAADAELFDEEGNVKEEYADALVTVVTQYNEPATITGTVDDTCATFTEVGANFENGWFFDDLGVFIGSKYDLSYWGELAIYAHEYTSFTTSRPIESITCYAYNDMGSLVAVSEDNKWIEISQFGSDNTLFKVTCEDLDAIPESAKNYMTREGEAVILIKYTDGSYSAIYFHIGSSSVDDNAPKLAYESYANDYDGTTLVELTEGELWQTYFYEYNVPVYLLTYTKTNPTMSMFSNLPENSMTLAGAEWLSYEYGEETQMITMAETGNGQTGALLFYDDSGNKYVIVCQLNIIPEEE